MIGHIGHLKFHGALDLNKNIIFTMHIVDIIMARIGKE
jgi:hypothetical protein